jgi:hypothetical protein
LVVLTIALGLLVTRETAVYRRRAVAIAESLARREAWIEGTRQANRDIRAGRITLGTACSSQSEIDVWRQEYGVRCDLWHHQWDLVLNPDWEREAAYLEAMRRHVRMRFGHDVFDRAWRRAAAGSSR